MNHKAPILATALLLAGAAAGHTAEISGGLPPPAPPGGEPSLKAACAGRFTPGAAIPGADLTEDERRLLFKNFGTVTPENCMKAGAVHPAEDRFDFARADALVAMARDNGLAVNGHTLVWHQHSPDWFFDDGGKPAGRDLVLRRLQDHIATVAGHFKGRLASWDVVNEAVSERDGYLRDSKWLAAIGENYIAESFKAAHRADPGAELYYNDFHIESPSKRDKTLRLLRELKEQGAPVHGVGIQGHWQLDRVPFQDIEEAIVAFHAEGLKVSITELDIDVVGWKIPRPGTGAKKEPGPDPYREGLPEDIQRRLADQYARLFAIFLKHADKIDRVTFWGLHDGRSWLNYTPYRRTNHPLLWDRALQPKPALCAVLDTLPPSPSPVPGRP